LAIDLHQCAAPSPRPGDYNPTQFVMLCRRIDAVASQTRPT
jgi:hypothetical protein